MNYKEALYLAIKYIQDTNDLNLSDIAHILQVSNERLKEFMSDYEQNRTNSNDIF
jgi:hypothetical protein